MVEGIKISIQPENLEKLRCSVCQGYLSCPPICLLPDGTNICGQCSPNNDTKTYRQLTLEALISNAEFPCKYNEYGCSERLRFGCTIDHEVKCAFRPIACPSVEHTSCTWEGSLAQISTHFNDKHYSLVRREAEFKLEINESASGILMVNTNNGVFLLNYHFEDEECCLYYNIKHFSSSTEDVFGKIRLVNDLDTDYLIQLKGSKCLQFNHDMFNKQNETELDLNKFLEILDNPERVKVTFDVTLPRFSNSLVVDYPLLESMKCDKCHHYLIPPIYYNSGDFICANCSNTMPDCSPSYNRRREVLNKANFPCRWKDCTFVAKGKLIADHEIECEHRLYRCLMPKCNVTFNRNTIIKHLRGHKCKYFEEQYEYTIKLSTTMDSNYVFTIIKNEIVVIQLSTSEYDCKGNAHFISVQNSSFQPRQFAAYVQFAHNHCKCKSKRYLSRDIETVTCTSLPHCFECDDVLSGVLKACCY